MYDDDDCYDDEVDMWKKGQRVCHTSTGMTGTVTEIDTDAHTYLWVELDNGGGSCYTYSGEWYNVD